LATKAGVLQNCSKQSKEAYALYLKNAGNGLWDAAKSTYKGLDQYTKLAMETNVVRGNALKTQATPKVSTKCLVGDQYTLAELKEICNYYNIPTNGMPNNKLAYCQLLQVALDPTIYKKLFDNDWIPEPLAGPSDEKLQYDAFKKEYFPQASKKKKDKITFQNISSSNVGFQGL
jgi:hypothetical protein